MGEKASAMPALMIQETNSGAKDTAGTTLNADDLLDELVKPCGLWQWSIVFLLTFSCSSLMTFPVYANSASPHRCRMEPSVEYLLKERNLSFDQVASLIGPWKYTGQGDTVQSGCYRYRVKWGSLSEEELFRVDNASELEPCPLGYIHDSNPYFYPGNVVSEFETVCDRAWLVPLGTSIYMFGAAMGNLLGGWSGGRFGRKKTLILVSVIEFLSGIWTSLSPSYLSYVLARGFMAVGMVAKSNVTGILMMELTLARYRSVFRAILSLGLAFIYRSLMALWAYWIPDWRWLNVAVTAPNMLSVLYLCLLPESPRWLFSQKRYSEGIAVLKSGYRINHLNKPKPHLGRFTQLANEAKKLELSQATEESKTRGRSCQCSLIKPLYSRKLFKTTMLSIIIMLGVTMSFIGLLFYARVVRHYVYVVGFLNALTGVPGIVLFSLLYRFFRNRKRPLATLVSLACIILLGTGLYTIIFKPSTDTVLIVSSNICLVLLQASLNMGVLYVPELFSSEIRTQGFGLIMGLSKVGGIVCSFVNALDQQVVHGCPLLIYSGVLLLVICSLAFLRDTSGENLPDN
ncbi:solute carrier family 22 member 1 [Clonorchis sinensis]|uniref:Solute carrier family 22 member 1 n=1 Tax=Clonorchis sinensis TaxID=79923 RepID=G7YQ58_CLOSI|nr:solute carrier family 22 member 1 [Clonorchis sinensis]